MSTTSSRAIASAILLALSLGANAQDLSQEIEFNIAPKSLPAAIIEFSKQTGVQVVTAGEDVSTLATQGVSGRLTISEALQKLLSGTELRFRPIGESTVALVNAAGRTTQVREEQSFRLMRVAATDKNESNAAEVNTDAAENLRNKRDTVEEVIVTGTFIKGATSTASPFSVHSRDEIDRSGAGSLQRFIQTLPENFQGGAWEGTLMGSSGGGTAANAVNGTGVNLRGLGNDSSLVLINGRRLAPGNTSGNWVDVSMIPVAAIERVEVVPDGASALYGSDAVGGVVNFIMRKGFEGAETRARYGSVTEGALEEYQLAQAGGTAWDSGSALVSYEYFKQSSLDLNEKSWVRRKLPGVYHALPNQERHGVFASIEQAFSERVDFFADVTFSRRESQYATASHPLAKIKYGVEIDSFSATSGARFDLTDSTELEISLAQAQSDTQLDVLRLLTGAIAASNSSESSVSSLEMKVTGAAFDMPAGSVSYAAGLQWRSEDFKHFNQLSSALVFEGDRTIKAGFAEFRVPLLGTVSPTLEMTLAGRFEEYDDFGSSANPKIGLIWNATPGLRLRGTWGKSFKAPLLRDLSPGPEQIAITSMPDPREGDELVPVAMLFGGNPDLRAERATSWTIGLDWRPEGVDGLTGRLTYYDISYTQRISSPQLSYSGFMPSTTYSALQFENVMSRFITRDPSVQQMEELVAKAIRFDDYLAADTPTDLGTIRAIIDYSQVNLSAVSTSGVDFGLHYRWDLSTVDIGVGFDGTYILELDERVAPDVPVFERVNTVFSPADLKTRANATLHHMGFSAAFFINYTSAYHDTRTGGRIPVSSWTTLDANVRYEFPHNRGFKKGLSLDFGLTNLTDQAPPYIEPYEGSVYDQIVFDGANADIRGRFMYAQIAKKF